MLILAAALRLYRLDAQSLWYDEGNSARIAERSLALIVAGAAGDIHPPLYYILLKYWRAVFGAHEAALRSLSAVAGTITVLFAYFIGRDLFGRRAGLIAAFLLAVAPFAVYYAQEARMYAVLALWAAASTWAMFHLSDPIARPSGAALGYSALYALATAAGLWTHYAYPFVMIAQGAMFLGLWLRTAARSAPPEDASPSAHRPAHRFEPLIRFAALNAIALALYAPWLPIALRQLTGWGVGERSYALGPAVLDAYRTLVVGRTLPGAQAVLPLASFTALALCGALLGGRAARLHRLALFGLALVPLALLFAFGLYRDAYLKFLLVCVLPWCVLAGHGTDRVADAASRIIARRSAATPVGAAVAIGVAFTLVPSLDNLYHNPAYARDDYRGIQRMIAAHARDDDAVLFLAPNQWEVYTFYQPDARHLYPLTYRPASYEAVAQQMKHIVARHPRFYVLYFAERDADPEGWYEFWMSGNVYKVHERWVGNIRLAIYAGGADRADWPVIPGADFGPAIELIEARARLQPVQAGDIVPVELNWRTRTPLKRRYKVFVHIGPPDGPPVAQYDGEPVAGYRPTDRWSAGEVIADRRGAWIAPGTPSGTFRLYIGLYDAETGERVPIAQNGQPIGDRLPIGAITIH